MANSPKYKVYEDKIYVASCKDIYHALVLCDFISDTGFAAIKYHHALTIFSSDDYEILDMKSKHGTNYDTAIALIDNRIELGIKIMKGKA